MSVYHAVTALVTDFSHPLETVGMQRHLWEKSSLCWTCVLFHWLYYSDATHSVPGMTSDLSKDFFRDTALVSMDTHMSEPE